MSLHIQDSTGTVDSKNTEVVEWIITTFGQDVQLDITEALRAKLTLRDVVERSERLHNSLDLMESFARLAHMLKKRTGVKVRLPNFPADQELSDVLAAFVRAYEEASQSMNVEPQKEIAAQ